MKVTNSKTKSLHLQRWQLWLTDIFRSSVYSFLCSFFFGIDITKKSQHAQNFDFAFISDSDQEEYDYVLQKLTWCLWSNW